MPDQDFNIKVVTTADTSGIQKTDKALQDLRDKQRQDAGAAALFARIPPGGPIPPAVAEKAGSDIGEHIGRGFERVAIHAIGVGVVLQSIEAIKQMAAEINKITDELDKQGELLVENSRQMSLQSKFAKDDADVLKIAEEGMKAIAAQHKITEEIQKKELTNYEKAADLIQQLDPTTTGSKGANQSRLDEEKAQAQANETAQRASVISSVRSAELEKERVAALSTADAIQRLNEKIKEQQDLQAKHYQQGDIQGYVESSQAIQQYKKQLDSATQAHQKQQDAQDKAVTQSSPAVQAVLKNEAAAHQALADGREKDADMFTKSAEAYERGLDPVKQAELKRLREQQKALESTPTTRRAGVGESQDLIDEIERRKKAFDKGEGSQDFSQTSVAGETPIQANARKAIQHEDPKVAAERHSDDLITEIRTLAAKFDRYWG